MTLTNLVIFACVVYLAIVFGRMSAKNDMRRRFASIEEGQNFTDVESVINYVLELRDQVAKLEHDNKALQNSLNIANAAGEKLERDYKALMVKMKVKREECEMVDAANKKLVAKINKCADKFDKWMQKLWEFVSVINDNTIKHNTSINEYCDDMDNAGKKQIYVTELLNKSHLLSSGEVEVHENGKL